MQHAFDGPEYNSARTAAEGDAREMKMRGFAFVSRVPRLVAMYPQGCPETTGQGFPKSQCFRACRAFLNAHRCLIFVHASTRIMAQGGQGQVKPSGCLGQVSV